MRPFHFYEIQESLRWLRDGNDLATRKRTHIRHLNNYYPRLRTEIVGGFADGGNEALYAHLKIYIEAEAQCQKMWKRTSFFGAGKDIVALELELGCTVEMICNSKLLAAPFVILLFDLVVLC